MAVRRPSAGIHTHIFFGLTIPFFFGLIITQLSPGGALHVVNVRAVLHTKWVIS
jgi:hypothetical protein